MKDTSSDKSTAMTKDEAIEAMLEGKRVRHRYFSDNEWVTMPEPFIMLFEDGVKCHPIDFWNIRRDKSMGDRLGARSSSSGAILRETVLD